MTFDSLILEPAMIVALFSGLAATLLVIAVSWPYLQSNIMSARIRQITRGNVQTARSEQAKPGPAGATSLVRREPRKIFMDIVRSLDLVSEAENEETIRLLQRAGYRGRSPVITYLALRIISPLAVFCVVLFYVFVVIKPDLPVPALVGFVILCSISAYYLPLVFLRNRITKRQTSIRRAWPNALDLLLICVESGMSSEASFRKVTQEIGLDSPALAEELSMTSAELAYLPDRRTAYENLATRTDIASVKSTIVGLIQSEKHGTSLGQALRVLSRESREGRMADAEQKAAALPPKLTVPMIIFFLPVLFAVILAPMIIQAMAS